MKARAFGGWLLCAVAIAPGMICAQNRPNERSGVELRLRIVSSLPGHHRAVPAVIWLVPLPGTPALPFVSQGNYTLLQKNRTFIPHLQVIPVGSMVEFPTPIHSFTMSSLCFKGNGSIWVSMRLARASR